MEQQSFLTTRSGCIACALLAMMTLSCPASAQTAESVPGPAVAMDAIVVTTDTVKPPSKHREVVRAPARPAGRPSLSQQAVERLR